ncbi:ribonuclease H1-like protein [Leptotrombidium deliense]|uniref:Ribonuclease H n=1 Tax=Leptotrombidium deliense TaxID=299467 RepID=A0A443SII0_9ACAR|nr:ribonuclease H1-like protein [Leptotrombidium deliense]
MPGGDYYAVANGRNVGIYSTWPECDKEVKNFSNARYKKFRSKEEAQRFIDEYDQTREIPHPLKKGTIKKKTHSDKSTSASTSASTSSTRDSKHAIVYTDGACSKNGYSGAKAGIGVFWGKNDPRNVSAPLTGRPTNNRAEIHAAIIAIKQAKKFGYDSVTIRTDSKFLMNSMKSWVKKWSTNGWKLSNGNDVVNKEDFEELLSVMDGIKVNWEKVSAHSGIPGNEAADKLAVQGAKLK